ncbi:sulfate transporter family-domain-containing protein [Syncephalis fuscata]|nr:sulfate transporter family-domain-containing protein [Syncephalis fuscata]
MVSANAKLLYIQRLFPIIGWLPYYNRRWFTSDLSAGLTIGVMIVPQSIAYTHLVGLPVEYGLYASLVSVAVYGIFGTSKDVNVGATAVLSLYIGQGLHRVVSSNKEFADTPHMAGIAAAMAFMIGCITTLLGLLRAGIILDFISAPVIVGFTFGAAIDIMLTQIPKLLGVAGVNTNEGTFGLLDQLVMRLKTASLPNLGVGLTAVVMLLALKAVRDRFGHRSKAARIIGTARIAITVVFYTLVSFLIAVAGHGDDESAGRRHPLNILRKVPRGLPAASVPPLSISLLQQLLAASLLPLLQTVIEHVTISKALGRMGHYNADSSQELVAVGMSNISTSFFSGFGVTGAMSRSLMVAQVGSKTPLNGAISSIVICCALLFLPPAFYYIPDACLAGIIITSVFGLMRGPKTFIKLWHINPIDMITCLVAFIFTVAFDIAIGIGAAVGLSIILMLYKVARPDCILLEPRVDNPNIYVDPSLPDVVTVSPPPGIVVFRVEEAIIFPNAYYIRQQLLNAVKQRCKSGKPPVAPEDELWCNVAALTTSKKDTSNGSADSATSSIATGRFAFINNIFRRGHQQQPSHGNNENTDHQQYDEKVAVEADNTRHATVVRNSLSIINVEEEEQSEEKKRRAFSNCTKIVLQNQDELGKSVPINMTSKEDTGDYRDVTIGLTERPPIKAVIMDFGAVNNIDASGLQTILDIKSELSNFAGGPEHQFQLHFVSVKRKILRVLELSGITKTVVPVLEDERREDTVDQYNATRDDDQAISHHVISRKNSYSDDQYDTEAQSTSKCHAPETDSTYEPSSNSNISIAKPIVGQGQKLVHFSVAEAVNEVLQTYNL